MLRRFSVNFALLSMSLDMLLTLIALKLAVFAPAWFDFPPEAETNLFWFHYLAIPLLWAITFLLASVYDPKNLYKAVDEFQSVTLGTGLAALVFAGLLFLTYQSFSRWLFLIFVSIDLLLLLGWRIASRLLFRLRRLAAVERRVLIVGAGAVGRRVGQMIKDNQWMGLIFLGYLDNEPDDVEDETVTVLGGVRDVRKVVEMHTIDDVVIALPQRAYGLVNELTLSLHDLPVNVRVVPDYFSLAIYRASVEDFGGVPMINLRDPALNDVQRLLKRIFDLALGTLTLLLALPVLGAIALAVKLDSAGPVLFRQQRVGENGRIFGMYKFRSMVEGAEAMQKQVSKVNSNGQLIHKCPDDPRVTRIGRILRRTSLDELPQLLNVLKGDMSLVGPRPELPWMVGQYEPWQHKRLAVPQGMTGWWQVNGRADKPLHLHTEDDIYYVQHYSLWMDIYILLKTPWVVMRGIGAY